MTEPPLGQARADPRGGPGAHAAAGGERGDAWLASSGERLAALVATRLPGRAAALVGLLAGPGSAQVAARAALLASASREERLRALAAALAPPPREARWARAQAVARGERAAAASATLAVARLCAGAAPIAPLLERLIRERLQGGRAAPPRPAARTASSSSGAARGPGAPA